MPINEKEVQWDDEPIKENQVKWDDMPTKTAGLSMPAYDVEKYGELNPIKAAIHGLGQGVTFGLSDEILGALQSIGGGTYKEERDKARAYLKALEKEYPKTSIGSDIAGGVATGIASGGLGALKTGYTAVKNLLKTGGRAAAKKVLRQQALRNVGRLAALGAAEGGMAGYGYGEAETMGGQLEDIGKGAAIGAGASLAVQGVGAGAKMVKKLGRKTFGLLTGVKDETVKRYLKRPKQIQKWFDDPKALMAKTEEAKDVIQNKISKMRAGSGEAFEILEKSGVRLNSDDLVNVIDDEIINIQKQGVFGSDTKKGLQQLLILKNDISQLTEGIPAQNVKSLIQDLDDIIGKKGEFAASGRIRRGLMNIRQSVDNMIKTEVPQYAEKMKDVAGQVTALDKVYKSLDNPDTLMNQLKQLSRGKQTFKGKRLENLLGKGFINELQDISAADQFTKGATQGSRRVVAGLMGGQAIGGMVGGGPGRLIGGAAGAGLGFASDIYGPRAARATLSGYTSAQRNLSKVVNNLGAMGKFSQLLQRSQRKGQLALTHALLYKKSMEYRQMVDELNKEKEEKKPMSYIPSVANNEVR